MLDTTKMPIKTKAALNCAPENNKADSKAPKRVAEAMRLSEAQFAAIFMSTPGSIAVTDADGNLVEANQAFCNMFGHSAEDLHGVPLMSLSITGDDKDSGKLMKGILAECEQHKNVYFRRKDDFIRNDGERITVDYGLAGIHDADGNVLNYIFSGVDISLQIKHAEELRSIAENQRWHFAFLRQLYQFEGVDTLFDALKGSLSSVIAFSSLKLIIPSFLNRSWVFDDARDACETHEINDEASPPQAISNLLAGVGMPGRAYVDRTTVNYKSGDAGTAMAVPLLYKEKAWGVIVIENNSSGAFSDEDIMLMNILGNSIGLYFEEQTNRSERDTYNHQLHQLHIFVRSLLTTQSLEHLLEGMLAYISNVIPNSACAVYRLNEGAIGANKMERLAWYDVDGIPIPDDVLVLKSSYTQTPIVEYNKMGLESRRVWPIIFQSRTVGAVDVYKPIGMQIKELEMYQLLIDYTSSFWALYYLVSLREEEASIDSLTGIWNRRYMHRRFQEESDRIDRYSGNACVVIGDMGNFKYINDNHGHHKGDEVLIKVAQTLQKNLRVSDSVGRHGGDEFIMLLPNASRADAWAVLERIEMEIKQLRIKSDDSDENSPVFEVIVDFGVAEFPGKAETLIDTIKLADEDMYANKTARKTREGLSLTRGADNILI